MAKPRTDYENIPVGLMVELTSALLSLREYTTPVEIEHACDHIMASLELAKRLLKQDPAARCGGRPSDLARDESNENWGPGNRAEVRAVLNGRWIGREG